MLLEYLNELLRVVDLFLKENECGHLTDEVIAYTDHIEFGLLFKFGVIH